MAGMIEEEEANRLMSEFSSIVSERMARLKRTLRDGFEVRYEESPGGPGSALEIGGKSVVLNGRGVRFVLTGIQSTHARQLVKEAAEVLAMAIASDIEGKHLLVARPLDPMVNAMVADAGDFKARVVVKLKPPFDYDVAVESLYGVA